MELAEAVGREVARRGARAEGGTTIGILSGRDSVDANPHLDIALPTEMEDARNYLVATVGEGAVAVGGALGTLSEIAFALKKRLPLASLESWKIDADRLPDDAKYLTAATPSEAVEFVMGHIERSRAG